MIEDEDSEGEDAETDKNKKNKNEKYEQKPEAQGLPEKNDTKMTIEKHSEEAEDSESQELERKKPTPLVSQTVFTTILTAILGLILFTYIAH